jgi:hypothetical protein
MTAQEYFNNLKLNPLFTGYSIPIDMCVKLMEAYANHMLEIQRESFLTRRDAYGRSQNEQNKSEGMPMAQNTSEGMPPGQKG